MFAYFPLGKTIEDEGIKQVEALKALKQETRNQKLESIERFYVKQIWELINLKMI